MEVAPNIGYVTVMRADLGVIIRVLDESELRLNSEEHDALERLREWAALPSGDS